jgi:hypothetical protein
VAVGGQVGAASVIADEDGDEDADEDGLLDL